MASQIDIFIVNIEYVPNINKIHIRESVLKTVEYFLTLSIGIKKLIETFIFQKYFKRSKKSFPRMVQIIFHLGAP